MAQKTGSSINSELFMLDPVPGRGTKPTRSSGLAGVMDHQLSLVPSPTFEDDSFYVKGESHGHGQGHSHGGNGQGHDHSVPSSVDGDDIIIVHSPDGGSYKLNRSALKTALTDLKTQAHVSITKLSPDLSEEFRGVIEAMRLLHASPENYNLVMSDIREVFADVKDVKPGTVAASFIGCFNEDKFPGPIGCSPKCAAALPPADGTPGHNNCEDLVLIYTDGSFSSLNEKSSTHAYIYSGEENFNGFTDQNIAQLKEAGIQNATLIRGNVDGSYKEVAATVPVDQLPKAGGAIATPNAVQSPDATTNSSNATGAIVIGVIIIVIIVLLLAYVYRSYA